MDNIYRPKKIDSMESSTIVAKLWSREFIYVRYIYIIYMIYIIYIYDIYYTYVKYIKQITLEKVYKHFSVADGAYSCFAN